MAESSSLSLKLLPIKFPVIVFFILITTFPSSRCNDNENVTRCGLPYECGEVKNLHFPFWGDDRPQFCGHEGFKLRCWNREFPVINITGLDYRVLNVDETSNTMTLVRLDLWETPCSPTISNNTTLNYTLFNYPATGSVVNLTLYYDCPKPDQQQLAQPFPNNFSCPRVGYDDEMFYYYVRDSSEIQRLETLGLISACRGNSVQVPVFRTALDDIERSDEGGVQEMTEVLRKGFDVQYLDFVYCNQCEKSGGRCGTNLGTYGQ